MKYFEIFSLERHLSIDLKDLEKRFYALSRKLHPDVSRGGDDAMADLNDAWRTLRDPVKRAAYTLSIGEQSTKDVPADLLEDMFELNMAAEEGEDIRPQLQAMLQAIDTEMQQKFTAYDAGIPTAAADVRALLNKRKYITNLIEKTNVPD